MVPPVVGPWVGLSAVTVGAPAADAEPSSPTDPSNAIPTATTTTVNLRIFDPTLRAHARSRQ